MYEKDCKKAVMKSVLNALTNPGTPVVYNVDMGTDNFSISLPDLSLRAGA